MSNRDLAPVDFLVLFSEEYGDMETAPKALARFVSRLPGWDARPTVLRPDQVLDAELTHP
jgi:hypothetical protein